jgi:hypothetical protein
MGDSIDQRIADIAEETAKEEVSEAIEQAEVLDAITDQEVIEEATNEGQPSPVQEIAGALDIDAKFREMARQEALNVLNAHAAELAPTVINIEQPPAEPAMPEPVVEETTDEDEAPDFGHRWYRNFGGKH